MTSTTSTISPSWSRLRAAFGPTHFSRANIFSSRTTITSKGIISVGELDGLTLKNVRPILDEPEHISFPSVLYSDGGWYMTPERHNARMLRVYRATAFPDRWEPLVDVAHGRFDDPLLRETERGFEIWTTQADVLHVFEAKHIEGPWRQVRTHDAPFQRSAGNFIGDIRPTQDAKPVYGRAIKFLRGDDVVRTIEPTWYPNLTGTHTFNVSETHVVIDGRIALESPHHPGRGTATAAPTRASLA